MNAIEMRDVLNALIKESPSKAYNEIIAFVPYTDEDNLGVVSAIHSVTEERGCIYLSISSADALFRKISKNQGVH